MASLQVFSCKIFNVNYREDTPKSEKQSGSQGRALRTRPQFPMCPTLENYRTNLLRI
jgi:hypothetical protein